MTTHASLLQKYGSEAAIADYYRELSRKSRLPGVRTLPHKGGFSYNKELASRVGKIGGKRSKRGKAKPQTEG
jgi:hypothetical protein